MVSIIIPTYNRGHLIKDAVNSIISQSFKNWELIIVDDGSTDDTELILKLYENEKRLLYVKRPKTYPKGANSCRNYGLEMAKGKYIKWLDSDDILKSGCLEKQILTIKNEDADVNFCNSQLFSINNGSVEIKERSWSKSLYTEKISTDLILGNLRWPVLAGLWKKEILNQKPFNEIIQNSQEWLFHIEMSLVSNLKYSYIRDNLCLIRVQSGSMSDSSNKNGTYYYNASLARHFAIEILSKSKVNSKLRFYLLKKFIWYLLFTFYKGDAKAGIALITISPRTVFKTLF